MLGNSKKIEILSERVYNILQEISCMNARISLIEEELESMRKPSKRKKMTTLIRLRSIK